MTRTLHGLLLLVLAAATSSAAADDNFLAQFRSFADQHCVGCHGPDVQKRQLRLDTLPLALDDRDAETAWIKVLDQLRRGDMPPRNRPRPVEKEVQALTTALNTHLHAASLARQQREGRVVLRRLNRVEYETTLRDLLATPVEVRDLLPEDNSAAGFDNISTALDVSAVHLLRYQEAAERALWSVIPNRPAAEIKDRRTGRQITEKMSLFQSMLGKSARLEGDTLILYTRTPGHIPCSPAAAPVAGRYRIRASVAARGTGGQPLPMLCVCRDLYERHDTDVRAVHDIPADRAAIVEDVVELKPRQVLVFNGWSLPSGRTLQEQLKDGKLDDYRGPSLAFEWVEIEGPLDAWPGPGYQRLFAGVPLKAQSVVRAEAAGRPAPTGPRPDHWWLYDPLVVAPAKPHADAERLLRAFLPRAFRRPVAEALQRYYIQMVHAALDRKVPFANAMILGYKAALCSPHFLFLTEPINASKGDQRTALDDYGIATRLSYFLWSSMPDDELFRLAAKGELAKPQVRAAQVERMLSDPRAQRFTANFAGQWLDLRNINATSPDPQIYGEFDDFLFWSMPRETEAFFDEMLRADRSVAEFVHSDWTFLNQRLAQHYGMGGVHGGELRMVSLPAASHRGGVLTHASIMKVTADGTRTSPVLRGKWVLERILGQPPAPPPPDVPAIEPDIRGAVTIRQQLDRHRNTAACATCHRHIDPPGFALESFDVIGGWRYFYRATTGPAGGRVALAHYPGRTILRGPAVETTGTTADGRAFQDIDEYRLLLLADRDQLARNVAQKLLIYATGADLQFADREAVEELLARARDRKFGLRTLLHEVVQSRVFLTK